MRNEQKDPALEIVELYQTENFEGLKDNGVIDGLRLAQYVDIVRRAQMEKDPANKYEMMAKATAMIKQPVAYSLVTEYGQKPKSAGIEEIVQAGSRVLDDLLSQ